MIEWGFAILILLVMGFFIARSIVDVKGVLKRPEKQQVDHADGVPVAKPTPERDTKFIPDETKAKIDLMEKQVFDKADEAKRIADHESAIFPPELDGVSEVREARERNPQEESAIMRSISKKVEEVKKLSEQD